MKIKRILQQADKTFTTGQHWLEIYCDNEFNLKKLVLKHTDVSDPNINETINANELPENVKKSFEKWLFFRHIS